MTAVHRGRSAPAPHAAAAPALASDADRIVRDHDQLRSQAGGHPT